MRLVKNMHAQFVNAVLAILIIFLALGGCDKAGKADIQPAKHDVGDNICSFFDADFVFSAMSKPVVRIEPSPIAGVLACNYYTAYDENYYKGAATAKLRAGGPHVSIVLENLNVAKQRTGRQFLGLKLSSDLNIKMENIVTQKEDGSIWQVDLIINPDRYVWTNVSHGALTDNELLTFAARLAEKIQGNKLSFKIKQNPIDLLASNPAEADEQRAIVEDFYNLLAAKNFDQAVKLLDAADNIKKLWLANFATLEEISLLKVEKIFAEEWTEERQIFQVLLDVKAKAAGEQFGWLNGQNTRWVSLQKQEDGSWLIQEMASNP